MLKIFQILNVAINLVPKNKGRELQISDIQNELDCEYQRNC